jgi:predicted metal-binding membrane protein
MSAMGGTRLNGMTALVVAGYYLVWTVFGMAAFAIGVALAGERAARATGAIAVGAGLMLIVPRLLN